MRAKKSRKGKKYDPQKKAKTQALTLVVKWLDSTGVSTTNTTPENTYAIFKLILNWRIEIFIDCGDYIESNELVILSTEFDSLRGQDEVYAANIEELKTRVNKKHIRDMGWTAQPIGKAVAQRLKKEGKLYGR